MSTLLVEMIEIWGICFKAIRKNTTLQLIYQEFKLITLPPWWLFEDYTDYIGKRNRCLPSILSGLSCYSVHLFPNNHGSRQWPYLESEVTYQHVLHFTWILGRVHIRYLIPDWLFASGIWNPTHLLYKNKPKDPIMNQLQYNKMW